MKKYLQSTTLTIGLAIFAMLFGAGNLIFPLKMGVLSGDKVGIGLLGFFLSGICLPILGLVSIIFFNGDYRAFFYRIGKIPGAMLILFCMLVIGPLLVMPRIIDLTYELMRPFIGNTISILIFSIFFGIITFISCFKKNEIVDLLGKILSPIKLITLFTIIIIGYVTGKPALSLPTPAMHVFLRSFEMGYNTLDLLATIFFGYIIISILRSKLDVHTASDQKTLARMILQGSLIGGFFLAVVYAGIALLGALHGQTLDPKLDAGKMFIKVTMDALGSHGALFISFTVLVACLSTMIALASVVSEYLRNDIFNGKLSYHGSLIAVMITAVAMSQFELGPLLEFSEPIILIVYPVLVVLTLCNLAYKLWGFKFVKVPVFMILIISTAWYVPDFIAKFQRPVYKQIAAELSEPPIQ